MRLCCSIQLACVALFLVACGGQPSGQRALPTAHVFAPHVSSAIAISVAQQPVFPSAIPATPTPQPTAPPTAPPVFGEPLDQYRAWMEEARALHPYTEPI